LDLNVFGKKPANFPIVAQNVYKAAGLSGHVIPKPDAIANLISKRYSVKKWDKWNVLLQGEYEHAYMELRYANTFFDSHLSSWLLYQDAFNEIVFRSLQDFLASKGAPGASCNGPTKLDSPVRVIENRSVQDAETKALHSRVQNAGGFGVTNRSKRIDASQSGLWDQRHDPESLEAGISGARATIV
jgi:hypothetical protein